MGRLYTKYYNTLKRLRVRDIHQEFPQEIPNTYMQSGSLADDTLLTTQPTTIASNATTSLTTTLIMRPTTNANDANNISNSNSCSSNSGVGVGAGGGGVGVGSDGISSSNKQSSNTQIELIEDDFQELIQLDDTSVSAIKNFLHCTGLNWDDVKTMWSKTYLSRQEDVEHSTTKDILQQWPKYLNARGMELVSIKWHGPN